MMRRYTLRARPRDPKPFSNYEFDVLEGERVVARYWFDFRGDDHGVVFNDGRAVTVPVGGIDFVTGGPEEFVFTPSAIVWLEKEFGRGFSEQ